MQTTAITARIQAHQINPGDVLVSYPGTTGETRTDVLAVRTFVQACTEHRVLTVAGDGGMYDFTCNAHGWWDVLVAEKVTP